MGEYDILEQSLREYKGRREEMRQRGIRTLDNLSLIEKMIGEVEKGDIVMVNIDAREGLDMYPARGKFDKDGEIIGVEWKGDSIRIPQELVVGFVENIFATDNSEQSLMYGKGVSLQPFKGGRDRTCQECNTSRTYVPYERVVCYEILKKAKDVKDFAPEVNDKI